MAGNSIQTTTTYNRFLVCNYKTKNVKFASHEFYISRKSCVQKGLTPEEVQILFAYLAELTKRTRPSSTASSRVSSLSLLREFAPRVWSVSAEMLRVSQLARWPCREPNGKRRMGPLIFG